MYEHRVSRAAVHVQIVLRSALTHLGPVSGIETNDVGEPMAVASPFGSQLMKPLGFCGVDIKQNRTADTFSETRAVVGQIFL